MPNYPGSIGRSLYGAFRVSKSIDGAIDYLSNRDYTEYETQEFYKPHVNRWIERDKKAKEYLIYYKKEVLNL